jgi:hypothetical protein
VCLRQHPVAIDAAQGGKPGSQSLYLCPVLAYRLPMRLRAIIVGCAAFALVGCDDSGDIQTDTARLAEFLAEAPIGNGPDYWLEKRSTFGEWDRVGLVFGFGGDAEACASFAEGYMLVFSQAQVRCRPANFVLQD